VCPPFSPFKVFFSLHLLCIILFPFFFECSSPDPPPPPHKGEVDALLPPVEGWFFSLSSSRRLTLESLFYPGPLFPRKSPRPFSSHFSFPPSMKGVLVIVVFPLKPCPPFLFSGFFPVGGRTRTRFSPRGPFHGRENHSFPPLQKVELSLLECLFLGGG